MLRHPALALLVLLHGVGSAFALATLIGAWQIREVLRLVHGGGSWTLLFLLTATLALAVGAWRKAWHRWRRDEEDPDAGLLLRAAAAFALACLAFVALVMPIRFPEEATVTAALFYGAFLAWARALPGLRRALPARLRRGLDLALGNLVALVACLEIGLRVLAAIAPAPLLVTDGTAARSRRAANQSPAGTLHLGFPINRDGYYDVEASEAHASASRLVVSIGDSFSYGVVPHAFHYSTLVEGLIPDLEVYNMGMPAIGPRVYRQILEEEAMALDPDLVLIQLFLGNDLLDVPPWEGPPRWHDSDRYLVAVVFDRLVRLLRSEAAMPEATMDVEVGRDELIARHPWLGDALHERPTFARDAFVGVETRSALAICGEDEAIYERFYEALEQIVDAAKGVPLVFVMIPSEGQVEDSLWEEITARVDAPLDRFRPQRELSAWFEERDLPVLDLLPALQAIEPLADGRQHVFHLQDTHFNARGNEVAAREMARFIAPLLSRAAPLEAPRPLPLRLSLGDADGRRWLRSGWQDAESSHVWSAGLQSSLRVPVGNATDVAMILDCAPFVHPDGRQQRISVRLNGRAAGEVPLGPQRSRYRVELPGHWLHATRNRIEFRYAYAVRPNDVVADSQDDRELAVAWYAIEFAEGGPSEPRPVP